MQQSDTVTFGGSGLDRRADWRGQADRLVAMAQGAEVDHIALWHGKALLDLAGDARLARLPATAPALGHSDQLPVFLGTDEGRPVFAHDLSAWAPEERLPETLGALHDPSRQAYPGLPETQVFCELRAVMADLSPRDGELAATAKAVLGWHRSHRFCSACGAPSEPAQAGWQRDCTACQTSHFPRTDPVVIMLILNGNSELLGRSHGWPVDMYSLLAGFIEPGESIEAAVRREVLEEAGIGVGAVDYLASQPWPFPASLMLGAQGVALSDRIVVNGDELDDAIWVAREDMLAAMAGDHAMIHAPRRGSIARFILERWLADRLG